MLAVVFSVLAALLWSTNAVLASKATERLDSATLNYLSAFPAALILLIASFASGQVQRLATIKLPELLFLALTGVANYVVGRTLYYRSIQVVGAGRTVPIANVSLLVAPILAVAAVGELLTIKIGVGLFLVFIGMYFLTRRPQ